MTFLVKEWKLPQYRYRLHGKVLYAPCKETSCILTVDGGEEVVDLYSTHEKADTLLLLHALHAAKTGSKAVIIAEDTDVVVFLSCLTCPIELKCGTKSHT